MKNKISPQHPSQNKKAKSAEVSTSLRTWERGCWIVLLALTQPTVSCFFSTVHLPSFAI